MAEDEKKKKKAPGVLDRIKQGIGAGKKLYEHYMAGRKRMAETMPPKLGQGARGQEPPAPAPAPEKPEEPQATQPPKKKKKEPRGGVGGVLDAIEERKRRMAETLED